MGEGQVHLERLHVGALRARRGFGVPENCRISMIKVKHNSFCRTLFADLKLYLAFFYNFLQFYLYNVMNYKMNGAKNVIHLIAFSLKNV